jgi:hypothetical protein
MRLFKWLNMTWRWLNKKSQVKYLRLFRDLGEDRTLDPLIKSQLLYRLSYQVVLRRANIHINGIFATPEYYSATKALTE